MSVISSLRVPAVIDTAERRPAQRLRPYISRYAGFRIEGVAPGVTHGLPSRHVTLMIGLGAPFNIAHAGSFTSFVSGLHDTPALVERGRAIKGLHLFLTPLGTRSLLGVPASALAGHVVDLGDVIGTSADELQDRLRGAASWPRRFDILDDVFARALEERPTSREIGWAWRTLIAEAGRIRIEDLANEIGWSRRHFTEQFGAELGMTPKTLARILRFEHACALIKFRRSPLAEVASASGYHDQPHMTREWQTLAGCTPRAWIANELPNLQDYELAADDDRCEE